MTVYVDDMFRYPVGRYRRMKMSHMIADHPAELHQAAAAVGIHRRWYQGDHYDICLAKRAEAVRNGAIEVTMRQLAAMCRRQKVEGHCGVPGQAEDWLRQHRLRRR